MDFVLAAQVLEPGTELGDGLRVGHGGVITASPVVMLTLEERNHMAPPFYGSKPGEAEKKRAAREAKLAKLTPEQRAEICPSGLKGKARKRFIEEGLMLVVQAREAETNRQASEAKEESTMQKTTKKTTAKKTRKQTSERKPRGLQPLPEGTVTPVDIAKAAGKKFTPRDVRVVLRAKAIAKKDGRYQWPSLKNRQVAAIIKAVQAAA